MNDEIVANDLSWALNDLVLDLISAVSMGREVLAADRNGPGGVEKLCGRLRVCNHSIVLSLFKLNELNNHYGDFIKKLPVSVLEDFFSHMKTVRKFKVGDLRNAHVAHPIDRKTNAPISIEKLEGLMGLMTGKDNLDSESFYRWICPKQPSGEKCLVNSMLAIIGLCREVTKDQFKRS